MISQDKIKQIQSTTELLKLISIIQGKLDLVIDDLTALFMEVSLHIGNYAPLMMQYVALLKIDCDKSDPVKAFVAGKAARENGVEYAEGLFLYYRYIENDPEINNRLHSIILLSRLISGILKLQGNKSGLLTEFMQLYRQVFGAVDAYAERFYKAGYELR